MPFFKQSSEVYLVDGVRTIVGNPHRSLKHYSAFQLATCVIKNLIERQHIQKTWVDEVILGNTVSAGMGQNFARQATLKAGLPYKVVSYTINNVCGAGLQSVILAVRSIKAGETNLSIAGGAESATNAPYLVRRDEAKESRLKNIIDSLMCDGLFCQMTNKRMGDLVEGLAKEYRISRQKQDEFALWSHQKATLAQTQRRFSREIVALKDGRSQLMNKDDRPRRNLVLENFRVLPLAFHDKGTITAGNASVPCDGAAVVMVASKEALRNYKLKPMAQILGYVSIAVDPQRTFESAVEAIKKCLKECRLSLQEIDLFEISEAFAAQVIFTKQKLNIPDERLNIWGGDIALGHPLGAAGARILVTLLYALRDLKKKRGLACVCYGGGGAVAMVIEAV